MCIVILASVRQNNSCCTVLCNLVFTLGSYHAEFQEATMDNFRTEDMRRIIELGRSRQSLVEKN